MRRHRNPPPWVVGPDPNEQAHAAMNALVERLDPPPLPPGYEAARHEAAGLLAEACRLEGIPVVHRA